MFCKYTFLYRIHQRVNKVWFSRFDDLDSALFSRSLFGPGSFYYLLALCYCLTYLRWISMRRWDSRFRKEPLRMKELWRKTRQYRSRKTAKERTLPWYQHTFEFASHHSNYRNLTEIGRLNFAFQKSSKYKQRRKSKT